MNKKIILIIVEGTNDKCEIEAIIQAPYFSNYKDKYKYCVIPYGTDITGENFIKKTEQNKKHINKKKKEQEQNIGIKEKLAQFVINFRSHGARYNLWNGIAPGDIKEIVQIVDLDGVFIPRENIIKGDNNSFIYCDDGIVTSQVKFALGLHKERVRNLLKLIDAKKIDNTPYSIYFVSCNMDHVLFNKLNPAAEDKNSDAKDFKMNCAKNPEILLDSIFNPMIAMNESYEDSWHNIQSDCKSLQRHTNFNLFFGENAKNSK